MLGLGKRLPLSRKLGGGLGQYISLMSFWSDTFDFTAKTLLDKSGNSNDVPILAGNCVNFINDVTITLSTAQIGATVTEVNLSATTTGVTVNGSGHIEIDQSELPVAKIYQIKLDTDDELFLTGGINYYVFSSPTLYGTLGGTVDVDWEWETQDDYFGNLRYGFGVDLSVNACTTDMTDYTIDPVVSGFSIESATELRYTGGLFAGGKSVVFYDIPIHQNGTWKVKITTWDSTNDFANNEFGLRVSGYTYVDDDGVTIAHDGVHYITLTEDVHRTRFEMIDDASVDFTGKNFKFRVDYVREFDSGLKVINYDDSTDRAGNAITNPALAGVNNHSEVVIDFSGISGITGAGGGAFSPPADYTHGDALTNPMFKRMKFNSSLKEQENDYIIFTAFLNGSDLSGVLTALEESNMIVKQISTYEIWAIRKFDATRDQLIVFGKQGYNWNLSLVSVSLIANTNQLPVTHDSIGTPYIGEYNSTDQLGPYAIDGIGFVGGGHLKPSDETIQPDWEEITAFSDPNDTVTIGDTTEFPDDGKDRFCAPKYYSGGAYVVATRALYSVSGSVLSLVDGVTEGGVNLGSLVVGGSNPSQLEYTYQTMESGAFQVSDISEWTAVKQLTYATQNDILDYTTIVKATLVGDAIIRENIIHILHQKSSNIHIDYSAELLEAETINLYYGLQTNMFSGGGSTPKYYLSKSQDLSLQLSSGDPTSGDRATYPCDKVIGIADTDTPDYDENLSMHVDLAYGTPSEGKSTADYIFWSGSKFYLGNILSQAYGLGDNVSWRGGYDPFLNLGDVLGLFAYFEYDAGSLYFIVDFTDELVYGSINKVFTQVSGRNCTVIYKDVGIAIAGSPGTSFTIPDLGLDLTATAAGNIKLKLI